MLFAIAMIALGLGLLIAGGELVVRGAVGLARVARLSPAVIGLTIVAIGTSVPELAVGLIAALEGSADITVGNVVGSNIFNLSGILGVTALIRPMVLHGNTARLEYPAMIGATLLGAAAMHDGSVSRLEGAAFVVIYAAFTAFMVRIVRWQLSATEAEEFRKEVETLANGGRHVGLVANALYLLVGFGLLVGGGQATVTGSVDLARIVGLSERVIGLTVVAVCTGLPECVTSIIAGIRGHSDIAVANVIGSNLFNILGVLGVTSLIQPIPVDASVIALDNWWMIGITLGVFPGMLAFDRVGRGTGLALVGAYVANMFVLLRAR
jgi:cation:H+ antiporter